MWQRYITKIACLICLDALISFHIVNANRMNNFFYHSLSCFGNMTVKWACCFVDVDVDKKRHQILSWLNNKRIPNASNSSPLNNCWSFSTSFFVVCVCYFFLLYLSCSFDLNLPTGYLDFSSEKGMKGIYRFNDFVFSSIAFLPFSSSSFHHSVGIFNLGNQSICIHG